MGILPGLTVLLFLPPLSVSTLGSKELAPPGPKFFKSRRSQLLKESICSCMSSREAKRNSWKIIKHFFFSEKRQGHFIRAECFLRFICYMDTPPKEITLSSIKVDYS